MAYNRRRPTGGYGVSVFATPTKDVFEEVVEQCGFSCTVDREYGWRKFVVNGEVVEVVGKGERPNWAAMVDQVRRMTRNPILEAGETR